MLHGARASFTQLAWRGPNRHGCGGCWRRAWLPEGCIWAHRKAHTRFTLPWSWDGSEVVLVSRATDERGEVQPSLDELSKRWGFSTKETWETADHAFHFNATQRRRVMGDGSIHDAMWS